MYSKDDDVEQDADAVDDQRQEDRVLAIKETLPKALRTQVLAALTSNFGLEDLVQYDW